MIKYDPATGSITYCIDMAVKLAALSGEAVELEFNGDTVRVMASHGAQVYAQWSDTRERRQAAEAGGA